MFAFIFMKQYLAGFCSSFVIPCTAVNVFLSLAFDNLEIGLSFQFLRACAFCSGSFSVFDFQNHGNSNYSSPDNAPRTKRSSQGKMEKSFLRYNADFVGWVSFHTYLNMYSLLDC